MIAASRRSFLVATILIVVLSATVHARIVRYQTAITVVLFAAVVAAACRRRGRWRDLGAFALGGAPLLLVFLGTNYSRYGDLLETGYPAALPRLH